MENRDYKKAKKLITITAIIILVTGVSIAIAVCLQGPASAGRYDNVVGTVYEVFAFIGLIGFVVGTPICLTLSIIGTECAKDAVNEGHRESRKIYVLGIFESVISGMCHLVTVFLIIFPPT